MQEDQITAYLQSHPEFFEKNANLLADIHLPSPHGNGAISLVERQQLAQRDKINALEERYAELVLNAQDNDQITNKLHQFFVLLQKAKSFDVIEQLINQNSLKISTLRIPAYAFGQVQLTAKMLAALPSQQRLNRPIPGSMIFKLYIAENHRPILTLMIGLLRRPTPLL